MCNNSIEKFELHNVLLLYWNLYFVQISGNKRPIRFPKGDYISSFQLFHCTISNNNNIINININININNNNSL